jgi:hypothetical protein
MTATQVVAIAFLAHFAAAQTQSATSSWTTTVSPSGFRPTASSNGSIAFAAVNATNMSAVAAANSACPQLYPGVTLTPYWFVVVSAVVMWLINAAYGLTRSAIAAACCNKKANGSVTPTDAIDVIVEKIEADERLSDLFLSNGDFAVLQLAFHLTHFIYIACTIAEGDTWSRYTAVYFTFLNSVGPISVSAYVTNVYVRKHESSRRRRGPSPDSSLWHGSRYRRAVAFAGLVLSLLLLLLLLPPLCTHILPCLFAYPEASIPTAGLAFVIRLSERRLKSYALLTNYTKLALLFVVQVGNIVYYTIALQAGFNWMALLYAVPPPAAPAAYIGVFALENSFRDNMCYVATFTDSASQAVSFASHFF